MKLRRHFSLKASKIQAMVKLLFNIVRKYFGGFNETFLHFFNLYIETGIFPEI